jgi:hypothetical protein
MELDMSKKLLIALSIAALSSQAMAMQITNGKLISHKTWTRGNVTGSFAQATTKSIDPKRQLAESKMKNSRKDMQMGTIITSNHMEIMNGDSIGTINMPVDLPGHSATTIENSTDAPLTYKITTEQAICYYGQADNCKYDSVTTVDEIALNPQGTVTMEQYPIMTKTFDAYGDGYAAVDQTIEVEGTSYSFTNVGPAVEFKIDSDKK